MHLGPGMVWYSRAVHACERRETIQFAGDSRTLKRVNDLEVRFNQCDDIGHTPEHAICDPGLSFEHFSLAHIHSIAVHPRLPMKDLPCGFEQFGLLVSLDCLFNR